MSTNSNEIIQQFIVHITKIYFNCINLSTVNKLLVSTWLIDITAKKQLYVHYLYKLISHIHTPPPFQNQQTEQKNNNIHQLVRN